MITKPQCEICLQQIIWDETQYKWLHIEEHNLQHNAQPCPLDCTDAIHQYHRKANR